MEKKIALMIIMLILVPAISANIVSINAGGSENIAITPGGEIENFFVKFSGGGPYSVVLSCPDEATRGESMSCTLKIEDEGTVAVESTCTTWIDLDNDGNIDSGESQTAFSKQTTPGDNVTQAISLNIPSSTSLGLQIIRTSCSYANSSEPDSTASDTVTIVEAVSVSSGGAGSYTAPSVTDEKVEEAERVEGVLQLFDIKFELEENTIYNSQSLITIVSFESFGIEKTPVNLTYTILDDEGNIIYKEKDTLAVETEMFFKKSFEMPYLDVGKYHIILETVYGDNIVDEFRQDFKIVEKRAPFISYFEKNWIYYLMGFVILILFIWIIILKINLKKGRRGRLVKTRSKFKKDADYIKEEVRRYLKESKNKYKKTKGKRFIFLFGILLLFTISLASSAVPSDELHLNIQTTDSDGSVETGTFIFTFNISTTLDCSNIVYSKVDVLTTDNRGVISYYLENVTLDFREQHWLCYYLDGAMKSSFKIVKTPRSFSVDMINGTDIDSDSINTTHIKDGTITDTDINDTTNLTLGQRITFAFGEIIDNIVDGWVRVTGGLNVTEDLEVGGTLRVNGTEVCLKDGTNCQGIFVNYTSTKITGNITNGTLEGYLAANEICNIEVAGTHMCQMYEILKTINNNGNLSNFTTTFRVSEGAPGFTANANDCDGWTSEDGTALGSIWIGDTTKGGSGSLVACNAQRAIACCI